MKSILGVLFSGEITFPGSWMEEHRLGEEQDHMLNLEVQIQTRLGEGQAELWKEYQEGTRQLEAQQCRMEFERGFLTAANLAFEVFRRTEEGAE